MQLYLVTFGEVIDKFQDEETGNYISTTKELHLTFTVPNEEVLREAADKVRDINQWAHCYVWTKIAEWTHGA